MNISNLKIGVRLAIGFAVTPTLLCAVAVTGYSSISSLDGAIKKNEPGPPRPLGQAN